MQEAVQPKKDRIEKAIRRKRIKQIAWIAGILLAIVLVIGAIVWAGRWRERTLPGVLYPAVGQEHIALNDSLPKAYNSNPPSSGAHFSSPANWSAYDYEVNDKIFIHNLEHGGIWIAYRPNMSARVVEDLKNIVSEFNGSKIVMAPRSANDADIALVAWARVLKFNLTEGMLSDNNKNDIRRFYRAFKNRGPEFVPDTMPGVDPKSVQDEQVK